METFEDTFKKALVATRKRGVKVRQNVYKCCRGCTEFSDLGMEEGSTQPYVWTFGGQGNKYSWRNGLPVYITKRKSSRSWATTEKREPVDRIYFNHGNDGAPVLFEEMRNAGLDVEWDGSEWSCVVVKPISIAERETDGE